MGQFKINIPNGCGACPLSNRPLQIPGRHGCPLETVTTRPDPMTEEEREAWLGALAGGCAVRPGGVLGSGRPAASW